MPKQTELSVIEHLAEFRRRLIWVIVGFIGSFGLGLYYVADFYRWLTRHIQQPLVVLGPNDVLWVYFQIAGIFALTVTLPLIVYHIWRYVEPALNRKEQRAIWFYIPAVFGCFASGLVFGFYIVVPALLDVLLSLGNELFVTQLTVQNYLSFVFNVSLPIGVMFEMPVIVALLTHLHLMSARFLSYYRRYAYFILLVCAVCLTPADFVSDLAMFIPLIGLYELSIGVSLWIERRRLRKE